MIAVLTTDGRSAPILLCDYCEERITDAGMGAAVFQPASESTELQPVLHVHKGRCHDSADAKCGGRTGGDWVELDRHLLQLLFNSGIDLDRLDYLLKQDGRLDDLP